MSQSVRLFGYIFNEKKTKVIGFGLIDLNTGDIKYVNSDDVIKKVIAGNNSIFRMKELVFYNAVCIVKGYGDEGERQIDYEIAKTYYEDEFRVDVKETIERICLEDDLNDSHIASKLGYLCEINKDDYTRNEIVCVAEGEEGFYVLDLNGDILYIKYDTESNSNICNMSFSMRKGRYNRYKADFEYRLTDENLQDDADTFTKCVEAREKHKYSELLRNNISGLGIKGIGYGETGFRISKTYEKDSFVKIPKVGNRFKDFEGIDYEVPYDINIEVSGNIETIRSNAIPGRSINLFCADKLNLKNIHSNAVRGVYLGLDSDITLTAKLGNNAFEDLRLEGDKVLTITMEEIPYHAFNHCNFGSQKLVIKSPEGKRCIIKSRAFDNCMFNGLELYGDFLLEQEAFYGSPNYIKRGIFIDADIQTKGYGAFTCIKSNELKLGENCKRLPEGLFDYINNIEIKIDKPGMKLDIYESGIDSKMVFDLVRFNDKENDITLYDKALNCLVFDLRHSNIEINAKIVGTGVFEESFINCNKLILNNVSKSAKETFKNSTIRFSELKSNVYTEGMFEGLHTGSEIYIECDMENDVIPKRMCKGCQGLINFTYSKDGSKIEKIGEEAFSESKVAIYGYTMQMYVNTIEALAFYKSYILSDSYSLDIYPDVIGDNAFMKCKASTGVDIHEGHRDVKMGNSVFLDSVNFKVVNY